jgi:anti-sigma regulatory factor (Ser/Thr protein kinase)
MKNTMNSITLDQKNSIMLNSCPEDLDKSRQFITGLLSESAFDDKTRRLLVLAVDEALAHIITYSQNMNIMHPIRLGAEVDKTRFVARIQDSCTDFTSLLCGKSEEDIKTHSSKNMLGVFLIRKIVDEVKYTFRRGFENELVLLKFVI